MAIEVGNHDARQTAEPPTGVRRGLAVGLSLLIAAGVYLAAVRGEALMIDLAGFGSWFCL